jgi:uncharacterized membrane protein YfcA
MTILALVMDFGLGALIGAFGGLFGVGGGVIAVPVLALLYGLDQQHAQGTAMVMVVPNVLLGLRRYRQKGAMDNRMALTLAASAVVFTLPFALLATHVSSRALRAAFSCFLLVLGLFLAWRLLRRPDAGPTRPPLAWGWSSLVGAVGGSLSGLFGVGGAMVAPPALTGLFGVKQTQAQGLALALVAPGTVVGLLTYATAGDVEWRTGIALAAGGLSTVSAGVALAHRLPERTMRLLFCVLMLVTALVLAVRP